MNKKVSSVILAVTFVFMSIAPLYAADGLRVDMDEVQINMSTKPGSGWNFTDLILYLNGKGLKGAMGYYDPVFTKVSTDSQDLLEGEEQDVVGFWDLDPVKPDNDSNRIWKRFKKLPKRTDEYIYIEGYVDVFVGTKKMLDIDNYLERSGKPLDERQLKKRNVEFMYLTKDDLLELKKKEDEEREAAMKAAKEAQEAGKGMEAMGDAFVGMFRDMFGGMFGFSQGDLNFVVKDPDKAIMMVELLDKDGKSIERESWSSSRDKEKGVAEYSVSYKRMLPYRGSLRIYLDDGKSIKRIPFKHKVALP